MERIAQIYQQLTGKAPQCIVPLAGAGSNRQYFRVYGSDELSTLASCPLLLTSLIAVIGTNQEENEAFIDLAKRFKEGNLPVPAVLAVSDDKMVYLQEDCGDVSLYAFIAKHRQADGTLDAEALAALKATIRELPRFQLLPLSQHSTLNTQLSSPIAIPSSLWTGRASCSTSTTSNTASSNSRELSSMSSSCSKTSSV